MPMMHVIVVKTTLERSSLAISKLDKSMDDDVQGHVCSF